MIGVIFVTLVVAFCLLVFPDGGGSISAARKRQGGMTYRLPDHIVPLRYTVEIFTDMNETDFTFRGKVWIKLNCVKATSKIVLHAKDLTIAEKEVCLKQLMGENETVDVPISGHQYVSENDYYVVMMNQRLVAGGNYTYYIPFKGKLNEGLAGFYRSSYFDKTSNKTKWLAVTQFEPTDARKAFPCFDEPAMKASFVISLGHSKEFEAISNMPLANSKPVNGKNGWVLDTFEETVPMSTYLVAFMLSEFDMRQADRLINDEKAPTFRIWARKEAANQMELAKDIGPKILAYYEKYFDTPYPLPKQDMVAVPDFSAGAMENWGLITYRETDLLFDSKTASIYNKHRIASVVAHELAHQWFGNLVTMKWWTDLWLNEGFATYVGALGVHHTFPEWKSLDSTIVSDLLTVFSLDALKSSHPVSVPIGNPNEIEQIFDTISYKKGSYLIRMMNMFMGEAVFQRGVTNYLKKHKFGNAAQDDLWEALTESAHAAKALDEKLTVKMVMDTWTVQTGYPVVTVSRDYEKGSATFAQERYLSVNTESDLNKSSNPCWWIPLSYTTSLEMNFNETKPRTWLTCDGPLTLAVAPAENWLLLNVKAAGLYRVNYDVHNWKLLVDALNDNGMRDRIDPLNRVQLLADSLGLAWVGKMDYEMTFDLVKYMRQETEYLPWKTALNMLDDINLMMRKTEAYGDFKAFMKHLLEPQYGKFSDIMALPNDFEGTKHQVGIVSAACHYGIHDCEEQAQKLFAKWYSGNSTADSEVNPVPKDLRSVVYCHALKTGGEKYWDFLWNKYGKSNVATEKQLILSSLGCVKDTWILQRYLKWSLDGTKIRKQDSTSVFAAVASNEVGFFVAKEFFFKNFMEIRSYHEKGSRLGRYLKSITNYVTTTEELKEFQSFSESRNNYLKDADQALRQGIESAMRNIAWHAAHYKVLADYFAKTKKV